MEGPDFLKQKYNNLHTSPEVESAAESTERHTKERVSQSPNLRIQNYLDRLEHLALDPKKGQKRKNMPDGSNRPRALSLLREMVMNEYVRPNKEKLAEGAAMVEERAARQMGIDMQYGAEQLEERGEIAVKDLEGSLDQWISYLSDLNEPYPTWFRYYAFRNILELGEYDKDKQELPKRTAGTNRLFPDIDRGALARIQDIIECSKDPNALERFRQAQKTTDTPEEELLTKEKAKTFSNLSFAKQYVESIKQAGEITPEMREETKGKWIKYGQDSDPTALWASLQNKGTAWCTKGFATALTQLKGGDFYVYYTLDKQGEPKIPRIAIRMQDGNISEARGVADSQQNLEGNMIDIAEEKMKELPGKERYQKISKDMKEMTRLSKKQEKSEPLAKDELVFLYELNSPIEGFGYNKDPRIDELKELRNAEEDMLIIFECTKEEVAHTAEEVTENTKAYLGKWNVGVFNKIKNFPNIQYLYESFPDKKIFTYNLVTNPEIDSAQKVLDGLKAKNIYTSLYAEDIINKTEFSPESTEYNLVQFTVEQLGFSEGATTDEIYAKAEELDLELCPAEVGPHLRLQYGGRDWKFISMKQIKDRYGDPRVFDLGAGGVGLRLYAHGAGPASRWLAGSGFVFRFRKTLKPSNP